MIDHLLPKRLLISVAFIALASIAAAAPNTTGNEFVTATPGKTVPGAQQMCLNGSGVSAPCGSGGTTTLVPTVGTGAYAAATVGASDSTVLAASTATVFLDLVNDSATATVCINLGATATITGTQCAAGEITLPPLWHRSWEGNFVPTDAVHAIASAASTQVAVGAK